MGREIKFKPATFYLGIADHLARVVEGQEQPEEGGSRRTSDERPEPERETSGERRGRERAEMADSLVKGESQAQTPVQRTDADAGADANAERDTGADARPHPQRRESKELPPPPAS